VATELHLVFDILQKFSFSSHKRHSVQDERMSDVLWSENKPAIAFSTDQEMAGLKACNTSEERARNSARCADHIPIFAGIADTFGTDL
jgi:hypothetical protein